LLILHSLLGPASIPTFPPAINGIKLRPIDPILLPRPPPLPGNITSMSIMSSLPSIASVAGGS